ncbi:aspartate aminotransferase [Devosia geojensis]|uniref:aspartate transaminase n=1 Tax=Devosia geojensis TaxID=443610 RepID=A0A0F5FUB0_9HYPH|nr:aspartate aminotransferase [Devosia geojensis]
MPPAFAPLPRPEVVELTSSSIRDIANAGMGRTDIAAFWFGESDLPTPQFIVEAGMAAMARGETRYIHNLGMQSLREAIAGYSSRLHGIELPASRIAVTSSGVSALMIAMQMVLSPDDKAVVVTPIWPNIAGMPRLIGADVIRHPLIIENGRWRLDAEALIARLTPDVRMLVVNSPNNPTGWTIAREDQQRLLAHCRKHGIWILSDEVYERLCFRPDEPVAPSMLAVAAPEDRLMVINSFSKSWRMTGWRIGWLTMPEGLMADLPKVIEYNTSCVPGFVQGGAQAAVSDPRGEESIGELRDGLIASRTALIEGLREIGGIEAPEADGAMYTFFRMEGHTDSLATAKALVAEAGLGLAPGSAFGPEAEGWLRWCYAADARKIADGLERLKRFLG